MLKLSIWWCHKIWISKNLDFDFLENQKSFLEAATGGVLWKKVFLEISQSLQGNTCAGVSSQNSQENTSDRVSFLIKLQEPQACNFIKKETLA